MYVSLYIFFHFLYICMYGQAHIYKSLRSVLLVFCFLKVCTSHHISPPELFILTPDMTVGKVAEKTNGWCVLGQSAFLLTL